MIVKVILVAVAAVVSWAAAALFWPYLRGGRQVPGSKAIRRLTGRKDGRRG